MNVTRFVYQRAGRGALLAGLFLALVHNFDLPASASMMAPGASIAAAGETDPIGGAVLGSTGPLPFATSGYSGTLNSTVIKGDTSNPFGPGLLTFTYRLTNIAASPGEIDRLTINNFASFLVDASHQIPAAGLAPTLMSRSVGTGDVVGFTFVGAPLGAGVLAPGTNAALLVVQTNATSFAPTLASVIDGQVTTVASYAPSLVPEPGSLILTGFGGAAFTCLRRRGRSQRC